MHYKECKICGNDKKAEKCLCSEQYTDCSICGNKVRKTAKKCTHCSHWIDGSTFLVRTAKAVQKNIEAAKIPQTTVNFLGKTKEIIKDKIEENKKYYNSEEYKLQQEKNEKVRQQQYAESLKKSRESAKNIYKKLRGWVIYFTINNLALLLFIILVKVVGDIRIINPSDGVYLENFQLAKNHYYQLTYIYANGVMPFISFAGIFFIIYLFPYYLFKIFFAKLKPEIREEYKSYKGAKIGAFATTSVLWMQVIIFGILFLINYWIYQIYAYLI